MFADEQPRKIALMDGSVVMLNKGSTLHCPEKFNQESRKVRLEGEAFFEVVYTIADRKYNKQQVPVYLVTAWFDKQIDFDNQPLSKVTEALSAMYEVDFVFEHESLKECLVTMAIEKTSISTAMKALKFAMGIDYTIDGRQIMLKGRCQD